MSKVLELFEIGVDDFLYKVVVPVVMVSTSLFLFTLFQPGVVDKGSTIGYSFFDMYIVPGTVAIVYTVALTWFFLVALDVWFDKDG